jgi:hypothetical protein
VFCLTIVEHEAASRVAIQQAMYARVSSILGADGAPPGSMRPAAHSLPRPIRSAVTAQQIRAPSSGTCGHIDSSPAGTAGRADRAPSGRAAGRGNARARASRVSKSACAEERSCRREVFAKAECFPMRAATALTLQCSAPAKRA